MSTGLSGYIILFVSIWNLYILYTMCNNDRNHSLLLAINQCLVLLKFWYPLQFMDSLLVVAFWKVIEYFSIYIHFSLFKFWYTLQLTNSCINYCNLNVKVDWLFLYLYSLVSLCHMYNSLKVVFGALRLCSLCFLHTLLSLYTSPPCLVSEIPNQKCLRHCIQPSNLHPHI
jgi:hypothetical protein